MGFPPVINLLNATFDGLKASPKEKSVGAPPKAPQPITSGQGMDEGAGLGLNAAARSGTNRVGTVLNALA